MAILDPTLIGEISVIVSSSAQWLKANHKIKGSAIPFLSGIFGAIIGVGWNLVSGDIYDGAMDWAEVFKGAFNGLAAAVGANGAFNLQKILPIPNVFPTSSEIDTSKMKEQSEATALVVEGVKSGVEPDVAKEIVGLEPSDPPPNVELEALHEEYTESVVEEAYSEDVDPYTTTNKGVG